MASDAEEIREAQVRLGANVERRRKQRRFTQEMLSDESGLTRSYIGKIESGRMNPRLDTLVRLATALNTTPAKLID